MFSEPSQYLWLIPTLPLLGSVVIALFGKTFLKEQSHWPCILGAVGACVVSVIALLGVAASHHAEHHYYLTWFKVDNVDVGFDLRIDGLTAIMLVMVTFIGSLIAIYSSGYMHHDPGYPRFFAAVAGFLFFMIGLVMANNFIVLYACWEGVGLCSYLLIGFWFHKPSAAAAARKAFLVTRLGDIGLFLGILLLWVYGGHRLDYDSVFREAQTMDPSILLTACLLLFAGAVGKSAQFPLHVWLPDAMEGPSPVSALIHAATMVTAGVYLVARCTPLFGLVPEAQLTVSVIGGITALLAALIALTQNDLKRVLAYSTLSQLGYMFMALGAGIHEGEHKLAALAVTAAIFHLFTHAFFKALLFLGAGSVMHAMGDVIDMRKFGGLRKVLPTTHWTFLCGSAALAGFPVIFSGFWSKDEILAVLFEASQHSHHFAWAYALLFVISVVTAGLTAFYTFRAYFKTFWGEEVIPHEAGHHAHESPPVMAVPLMILAVGAVGVGILLGPTHVFGHFLEHHWMEHSFHHLMPDHPHAMNIPLMLMSSVIAIGGIGLAYVMYVKSPKLAASVAERFASGYQLSTNKFFFDELYEFFIVNPLTFFSVVLRILDQYVVDGIVNLIGQLPSLLGFSVRPIQNGLVQFYALLMALGLAGFLLAVLLR